MIVTPITTPVIRAKQLTLTELLDQTLPVLTEGTIVAITSKIVSLCAGSVVAIESADREELISRAASEFINEHDARFGSRFTITHNTLIRGAGIDTSNGDGHYVLWLDDFQAVANDICHYLRKKYSLTKLGVIITDSTSMPLRRGSTGVCLAHCGFQALNNYVGQPDLFGEEMKVSVSNIAEGLASAAVVTMGEGREATPIAIIEEVPFVSFQKRNPTPKELDILYVSRDEDIFYPFLNAVDWQKGKQ